MVKKPKRLETRLIIWVTGLCVLQAVLFGALVYQITAQSLHSHMGDKALALATSIASRDDVQKALLTQKDHAKLNIEIEQIRELTENTVFMIFPDPSKIQKWQIRKINP